MSEGLEKLQSIGAQKIYEDTHIALVYVHSVLNENFEGLNKVQFVGFISILEREYNLDLADIKAKGLEYFTTEEPEESIGHGVFVVPKKKKNYAFIYIGILIAIFVIVVFTTEEEKVTPVTEKVDNSAIKNAQEVISVVEEVKEAPVVVEEVKPVEEKAIVPQSLKIIPLSKLWIGYIEKDTNIKKQTVITKPISLDPQNAWLLSLGHGNVEIEIDGELHKFHSPNSIRFLYEDGKLKELNISQFKEENKGRIW